MMNNEKFQDTVLEQLVKMNRDLVEIKEEMVKINQDTTEIKSKLHSMDQKLVKRSLNIW